MTMLAWICEAHTKRIDICVQVIEQRGQHLLDISLDFDIVGTIVIVKLDE